MTRIFRHEFPLLCQMPSFTGSETTDASTNLFVGPVSTKKATEHLPGPGVVLEASEHLSGPGVVLEEQETIQADIDDDSFRHNMNYVFAMGRCSQLCKTAGHDKVALASVVSLVDEATDTLRRGLHSAFIRTTTRRWGRTNDSTLLHTTSR